MRVYEIYMVTWMHFHGLIIQKHVVTTHQLRHFGPQLLYFATDRQIDSLASEFLSFWMIIPKLNAKTKVIFQTTNQC